MKFIALLLSLILITDCNVLSAFSTRKSTLLELYGTFHSVGINVLIAETADPDENAEAKVEYRSGNEPYWVGFPLTRISPTRFIGSLFWLTPGKTYDVRVSFTDPSGDPLDNIVLEDSISTRTEIRVPAAHNSYVVTPTGTGTACTLSSPCALMEGVQRAQPGDEVLLRGGVYYAGEISLPRSGVPGAPIMIRSYGNEEAVLDGADPTPRVWTPFGSGVYRTAVATQEIHLVTANDMRLYPYQDLDSLISLRWALPGFFTDGQHLYVRLAGDSDPSQAAIAIAKQSRGFNVTVDYIYFLHLTFRYFGQESETRAIYLNNASNNLIQGSTFFLNNGGITVKGASHRNVIQDNEFYDTVFTWSWDAVKAASYLERGGIFFGSSAGGRGNVIRRNIFHDFFDGFDICSREQNSQTDETDVYDNLIFNTGDDGLQVDGWCNNVRIWHNTFHNVLAGISFAPTVGGPVYVLRNLIYQFGVGNNDYDGRSFKFNSSRNERSGPIYLMHNTIDAITPGAIGIKLSRGSSDGWALVYARNNIWSSTGYALRNDDIDQPTDLDYDNLWSGDSDSLVRWDGTAYRSLNDFSAATGQEVHGSNINPNFRNPQTGDYTLNPTSGLIDAGVLIPGVNDHYFGSGPDVGAFESTVGAAEQRYLPVIVNRNPNSYER